jgi:hypothetical protein
MTGRISGLSILQSNDPCAAVLWNSSAISLVNPGLDSFTLSMFSFQGDVTSLQSSILLEVIYNLFYVIHQQAKTAFQKLKIRGCGH